MAAKQWPLVLVLGIGVGLTAFAREEAKPSVSPGSRGPCWDMEILGRPPKTYPAEKPSAKDVTAMFYDGLPWRKQPTRVFAYYGLPKTSSGEKLPGIVLIHGGGGTAFDAWVRLWNARGYAAIAMDTCGCVPIGSYGNWQRHAHGGPAGWGGFAQVDEPIEDQWTYHAVADVVLAHSLLRSLPGVDSDRIGVTGISWGGYLACIVSGVDTRFRFAVPVYGCGYLGENSAWLREFQKMGPEKASRWLGWWDPAIWLRKNAMPRLWVTGTNDFAYPMDSLQKSYRTAPGPRTLCIRIRMPHGHGGAGENPVEIATFADSLFRGGKPLARIIGQQRQGDRAWVAFDSAVPIRRAELVYTLDSGRWQDRRWESTPAAIERDPLKATARLPEGAKVYYFNLIDQRDAVVSSEHEEIP